MTFFPPKFNEPSFTCPHCGVYAAQNWEKLWAKDIFKRDLETGRLFSSHCHHCSKWAHWINEKLVDPNSAPAPAPHPDMPSDCQNDYLEARSIISRSPRGAAALLRLVVQKLLPHIGGTGANIDGDIKKLVAAGLPVQVQQSLDACRVIGNQAVHPGKMDISDAQEIAIQMCELINFIVENQISQPKKINAIFSSIPQNLQDAISKRDTSK